VDEETEKDIYLVLSATTKYRDLISITDAYSEFTGYKLIFTKLDETVSCGNLFNIRKHTGADMSYITCGQSVPDDIEPFSPQTTVKQLLGGR
ncbi:MAG TPA: flagellar biosynthesis protein FlhF, partial [Lachnospiraceae bacterium]|nr:flagellar biosynthesis protein FlhF [Lachnospiraceae bacterium]